jgi:hypothetical protein
MLPVSWTLTGVLVPVSWTLTGVWKLELRTLLLCDMPSKGS